jgi:cobalamin biosynthesis protein CobD/CbiB
LRRYIMVHEADERLRRLGGTAKLCLDVVNFDPSMLRAMLFALGGAVQLDPIKPTLKSPGTKRLKLKH